MEIDPNMVVSPEKMKEMLSQRSLPPVPPLRPVAEFDEHDGVLISVSPEMGFGVPMEFIATLSEEIRVIVVVQPGQATTAARNAIQQAVNQNPNATMDNINFLAHTPDTYWTRDFGPLYSFLEDGRLVMLNYEYGMPGGGDRARDNQVNAALASFEGIPIHHTGITHEGGDYMNDGIRGTASTSHLFNRPGNSEASVRSAMNNFFGIDTVWTFPCPLMPQNQIQHIDCWSKFLTPELLFVIDKPGNVNDEAQLNATATAFSRTKNSNDRLFEVIRAQTPNNQPFANTFISNDRVFVPIGPWNCPWGTINGHWPDEDAAWLQKLADHMPGYRIIGVPNTTNRAWITDDALHCRTMQMADRFVVNVAHTPFVGPIPPSEELVINAEIRSFTEAELNHSSIKVYYRINELGEFISIPMVYKGDDLFEATITGLGAGAVLQYYIRAECEFGIFRNHPFIGEPMAHRSVMTNYHPARALAATDGNAEVVLTWIAPLVYDNETLLGYRIYRNNVALPGTVTGLTFKDTDVVNNSIYTYFVRAIYETGQSVPSNSVTVMPINPDLRPARNLAATAEGREVTLTWDDANPEFESKWILYHGSGSPTSIGFNPPNPAFSYAMRFTHDQLMNLNVVGGEITQVKIGWGFTAAGAARPTYTLRIYSGGSSTNPGTQIHQQSLGNPPQGAATGWEMRTFDLTTPVPVPTDGELWVVIHHTGEGQTPILDGSSPGHDGFGNMFYWNGSWQGISIGHQGGPFHPRNWMIEAFVDYPSGDRVALSNVFRRDEVLTHEPLTMNVDFTTTNLSFNNNSDFSLNRTTPAFVGYHVERGNDRLTTTPIQDLTFKDTTPRDGRFTYRVIAVYEEGESRPVTVTLDVSTTLRVLLEEGFDGTVFPPLGWDNINQDGLTQHIGLPTPFWTRATIVPVQGDPPPHTGAGMAISRSWVGPQSTSPGYTVDRWLVTPEISVPAVVEELTLTYWKRGLGGDWLDFMEILVTTTGGLDTGDIGALPIGVPGTTIGEYTVIQRVQSTPVWTRYTVDLSEFIGEDIRIAFRHRDHDKDFIVLDEVRLFAQFPRVSGPIFAVSPNSKNFGAVALGSYSEIQTFTITNEGTETLEINSINLTGENAQEFAIVSNPAPTSIEPNATTVVTVRFEPITQGFKTAGLVFQTNCFEETHTVALSGVGGDVSDDDIVVIFQTALGGNYPNPFNPQTTIRFSLAREEHVSIEVFNIRGQRVTTLVNETRDAGEHQVVWRGTDDNGRTVGSGLYFYRMNANEYSSIRRMVLMK